MPPKMIKYTIRMVNPLQNPLGLHYFFDFYSFYDIGVCCWMDTYGNIMLSKYKLCLFIWSKKIHKDFSFLVYWSCCKIIIFTMCMRTLFKNVPVCLTKHKKHITYRRLISFTFNSGALYIVLLTPTSSPLYNLKKCNSTSCDLYHIKSLRHCSRLYLVLLY